MIRLKSNDTRMVRRMCNVKLEDWISTEEFWTTLKLKSMK